MSVRSRIVKVGAAKSVELGITSLVRFFSVPLFLHFWSQDLYGEWLVLYSMLGYFSLGGLGFGQAASNEITMAEARSDREGAKTTYQSTLAISLMLSAFLLLVASVLIFLLPLANWLNLSLIEEKTLRLTVFLFACYVVAGLLIAPAGGAFRAAGKMHRSIGWNNAAMLAEFGAMALVLALGGGPTALALSMLAVRLALVAAVQIDQLIIAPWLRPGFSAASVSEFRRLLSPALAFTAFPVGNTVINQGVVMAISAVIGPAAVVVFSTLRTLTNLVTRLFDLVNQAFSPEVSMAWGAQNQDLLRRLHRVSCRASLWLGLCAAAGLFLLGPWIYRLWTHGKVEIDLWLFWGFVLLVVIRGLWFTSFVVPQSINRHQRATVAYMIASIIGLGLSAALLRFGLSFSLAGFVLVELTMAAFVLPQSLGLSQENAGAFFSRLMLPPNPLALFRIALCGKKGE